MIMIHYQAIKIFFKKEILILKIKKLKTIIAFHDKFFKKIVDKEFEKISWGKIKFKIGNIFEKKYVGKTGDLESNIIINDNSVFRDLVLRGDLGFAESYISKKWDTSNLNNLLKILLKNQQLKKDSWKPNFYNKIIESVNFILKKYN